MTTTTSTLSQNSANGSLNFSKLNGKSLNTWKKLASNQLEGQLNLTETPAPQQNLLTHLNTTLLSLSNWLDWTQTLLLTLSSSLPSLPSLELLNGLSLEDSLTPSAELLHQPAVLITEKEDATILTLELAGISEKDLRIALTNNTLLISGTKPCLSNTENTDSLYSYHLGKTWSGQFQRAITLDYTPDSKQINAQFSKGLLTIIIKKPLSAKAELIKITTLN